MIGRESMVGGLYALDSNISISKAIVQVAGSGSVVDVNHVRSLAEQSVGFRTTIVRHEQVLLAQSQQSAACNAAHKIEARLPGLPAVRRKRPLGGLARLRSQAALKADVLSTPEHPQQ
jgi:hypothetical protein